MSTRKDTSAQMGQLLLQGWTMLEDVCCECYVPIMENKRAKKRLCVSCGTDGTKKAQEEASPMDIVPPPPAPVATVSSPPSESDISQRLADRMIAGWAMMGVNCPLVGISRVFVRLPNRKVVNHQSLPVSPLRSLSCSS